MIRIMIGAVLGALAAVTVRAVFDRLPHHYDDIAPDYSGRPSYEPRVPAWAHETFCQWPNRPCLCDMGDRII